MCAPVVGLEPLSVIGYVPPAVPAAPFTVSVDDPLPINDAGLNAAVTPAGNPVADSVT